MESNCLVHISPCLPPSLQELTPSTVNRLAQGRPFVPQNQAVLDRNEPYMTTNNW